MTPEETVMMRRRALVVIGIVLALTGAACSSSGSKANDSPPTTTGGPANTTTTSVTTVDTCHDDTASHIDDIPARSALLRTAQLPAGKWSVTTACRWSFSGQDLIAVPKCAELPGVDAVVKEAHSGYGRATWVEPGGALRFDTRSECR